MLWVRKVSFTWRSMDWGWLVKPCIGASVCLYAQMLGLDSRVAKCAADLILYNVDLILYKSDPVQKQSSSTR
jgi:hypothetical protein